MCKNNKNHTLYSVVASIIMTSDMILLSTKMFANFSSFFLKNICYGYSLEAPLQSTSNKYPQYMLSWRNKKNNFLDTGLIWSYALSGVMLSHFSDNHFYVANSTGGYPVAYLRSILNKWKKLKTQPLSEGSPLLLVVSPSALRAVQLNR